MRKYTGRNDAQIAMVHMAPKMENWICQQNWFLLFNGTECPFVTSDHPVTNWADRGDGAETGVGFADPGFRLLFPNTPDGYCRSSNIRIAQSNPERLAGGRQLHARVRAFHSFTST